MTSAPCPRCGGPLPEGDGHCGRCAASDADLQTATRVTPRPAPESEVETVPRIGDFELLRQLGRGGMGTVWEARQESMHRRVALKLLQVSALTDAGSTQRFEREAWIGGRLSHPGVVKVFEQGVAPGHRWIAMELVSGGSLHARLEADRRALQAGGLRDTAARRDRTRRMIGLFAGVADALAHVHSQGVIHRDLKPLNLLVSSDGQRLLVTDFGVAREGDASRLTQEGDFLGTLRYMSPEQLLAHRVAIDHRTDIWSLGVTLYEALTLRLPHDAQTDEGVISAISQGDPIPARHRSPDLPRAVETILGKCLERDPARRYASAAELRDDLVRWLEDRPVLARRPGPLQRTGRFVHRNRLPLGAAIVAAALVATVGGGIARQTARQRDTDHARAVLEQVVRTGLAPDPSDAQWVAVKKRVQEAARVAPRGEIAVLLGRAAATPRVTLERGVGLVAEPPLLRVDGSPLVDEPDTLAHAAVIEGSLDGGPWCEITSTLFRPAPLGKGSSQAVSLARVPCFQPLRSSPHRLALRARLLVLPADAVRFAGLAESRTTFYGAQLLATFWPALAAQALSEEARDLGTLPLALYDQYPDDYPRRVDTARLARPLRQWFGVEGVTLAIERAPADGRRSLEVLLESLDARTRTQLHVTVADSVPPGSLVVVGVALDGTFDRERPGASLAGQAVLRDPAGREVCSFGLVFGSVAATVASGATRLESVSVEAIGTEGPELPTWEGRLVGLIARDSPVVTEPLPEAGMLTVEPDAALARMHGCDPIVGEAVSFPVRIRVDMSGQPLAVRLFRGSAAR